MILRTLYAFAFVCLWPQFFGGGCALAQPDFAVGELPGGESPLPILFRGAIEKPARYRVIFIQGSGCAGMGPVAERYFHGLIHAEVLVLQKPGVDVTMSRAPGECPPGFVQWDALSRWAQAARIALQADSLAHSDLPQILVGASEGAEILPSLAGAAGNLQALVMISSSGLDPRKAGEMQAERLGKESAWRELAAQVASKEPDQAVREGRTLKYWRDMWSWQLAAPLLETRLPVLQAWGSEDALVPSAAFEKFEKLAAKSGSVGRICTRRIEGANHDLQSPDRDGLQWLWAQLERWARTPEKSLCAVTGGV